MHVALDKTDGIFDAAEELVASDRVDDSRPQHLLLVVVLQLDKTERDLLLLERGREITKQLDGTVQHDQRGQHGQRDE